MFAFTLNIDLPPWVEQWLEGAGDQMAFMVVGLAALVILACYLVFHRTSEGARVAGLILVGLMLIWSLSHIEKKPVPPPPSVPPKKPRDIEYPFPPPSARVYEQIIGTITVGGPTAPDGRTQVICDLPVDQRTRNVGGRDGLGLCVFSSIGHSARWQNERRLVNFQKQMRAEPGGGWPEKVDRMIEKYGKGTRYVQYEGGDPSILELALKTGRMPGVTYDGRDPHYGGRIAHMVNLVYIDKDKAAVLDNNFVEPAEQSIVWMSRDEFLSRWRGGGGGWAVVLLANPPPPPPLN